MKRNITITAKCRSGNFKSMKLILKTDVNVYPPVDREKKMKNLEDHAFDFLRVYFNSSEIKIGK